MKRLAVIGLALALTSCVNRFVPPDQAARIKTVGIVTLSGPAKLEYAAAAASNSRGTETTADDWSLDPFITNRVTELLKPYYDVRPVIYDKTAMLPAKPVPGVPSIASVRPQGLDAYIVITPDFIREADVTGNLFRKPFLFSGSGLAQFQGALHPSTFGVHASYMILVVDGRNGSEIATSDLSAAPEWRTVDQSWWADSLEAMSASQKQQLLDAFKQLIDQRLATDLRNLRLIP